MDKRKFNGGHKTAGRKPKTDEQSLVEKLTPMEEEALKALADALKNKQPWAVKLFMQYLYGMPKQQVENVNYNTDINWDKLFGDEK